jgi:hypothetical protein
VRTLKCTLLFFIADLLNSLGSKLAEALIGHAFGVGSTVFHVAVALDITEETMTRVGLIALAGPLFNLVAAIVAGAAWRFARSEGVKLFALYTMFLGLSFFLGNLSSMAFTGNFADAAAVLDIPVAFRYATSLTGLLALMAVMWKAGELLQPPLERLIVPFALSTALKALAYLPVPMGFVMGMLSSSMFWVVAFVSAWWHWRQRRSPRDDAPRAINLAWSSLAFAVLLVVVVRVLAFGVRFDP